MGIDLVILVVLAAIILAAWLREKEKQEEYENIQKIYRRYHAIQTSRDKKD